MRPCGRSGHAPAWGAGEQALPYEEGFGDLFHCLTLLPHGYGERGQADRSAAEQLEQGLQHAPVEAVQAPGVDLVDGEGGRGDLLGDQAIGLDLGVVADPAQQAVGDAGVPRERPAISAAPVASISTSSRPAERWITRSSSAGP